MRRSCRVGKGAKRRAHADQRLLDSVGTLRFAHPTVEIFFRPYSSGWMRTMMLS